MAKLSPAQQFVANQFHTRLANDGTAKAPGSTLAGLAPYAPLVGLIPGIGPPLAAGLTAANAISQNSAKTGSQGRTNQDATAAQAAQQQLIGVGNELNQRYNNASPGEQAALNYFFNRAGLGVGGNTPGGVGATLGGNPGTFGGGGGVRAAASGPGMGTAPGVNGGRPFAAWGSRRTLPGFQAMAPASPGGAPAGNPGPPGLVNGSLGIWNSPQYALARQAAEEAVQHDMQSNQLGFNAQLANRGIDQSSVQQGGQAAITAGANKSYADFTRQLALTAADKQDQLVNQYTSASQPSLNSGATAGSLYGQGAGLGQTGQALNQQQSNLLNSLLGQGVQAITNYAGLGKPGGGGGGDQGSAPMDTSGVDQTPTLTPADTSWMHARGGPVDAGGMPLAAGAGKPHTTPIPTAMLQQLIDHLVARSAGQSGAPGGGPGMMALPHRAQGGPVGRLPYVVGDGSGPELYTSPGHPPQVVGQHGPQLFTPPANGMIVPNPADVPVQTPRTPLEAALFAHLMSQKVG